MKKCIFALALGLSLLAVNPVWADTFDFTAQTDVTNDIKTGDINISLDEWETDGNGGLKTYQDYKLVIPGQTVSKIARITNNREPAWIRTKVQYISSGKIEDLDDSMLTISDGWIKQDDYYYYTKPVDSGAYVDLFTQVTIPTTWNNHYSGESFSINVLAEAIQAVNFTPDFEVSHPWFGTEIEQCVCTDPYYYTKDTQSNLGIIFQDGVAGFLDHEEDFFQDFAALMPGETKTDSFTISNKFLTTLPFTFRTEATQDLLREKYEAQAQDWSDDLTEEEKEAKINQKIEDAMDLLSKLTLTISSEDETIYEGALSAEELSGGIVIAELGKNESKKITFSVYMPEELQNKYSLRDTRVRWIFSTQYNGEIEIQSEEPETTAPSTEPETTASSTEPETTEPTTVPETTRGGGGGGGGGGGSDDVPSTTSPSSTEGTKTEEPATDPATEPATDPEKSVYPDLPDIPVKPDGTPDIPEGTPIEIYDPANPNEPVYRGPYSDNIDLPQGTYEIVMLDENGVPMASGVFTIDDQGVPKAFRLAATGDYSTSIYLLFAIALISGSMILILALRLRKKQGEEGSDDDQ